MELEEQIRSLFLTSRFGGILSHPKEDVWPGNCFRTAIRTRHKDTQSNPKQVLREVSKGFLKKFEFLAVFYHELANSQG